MGDVRYPQVGSFRDGYIHTLSSSGSIIPGRWKSHGFYAALIQICGEERGGGFPGDIGTGLIAYFGHNFVNQRGVAGLT